MATESETLHQSRRFRLSHIKGKLFEAVLVVATLVGLVALVMLFGFMFVDAVSPGSASAEWYLLFFATLVGPMSAFTLYSRRHPAVRGANARASAAVFGGLALSLAAFVVLRAMSPYGPLTYVITVGGLPLSVVAYGRYTEETYFIGPAVVLATLLAIVWTLGSEVLLSPILDATFELGVQLLGGLPVLGSVPVRVIGTPVIGTLALVVSRRRGLRSGVVAAGAAVVGTALVAVVALTLSVDPRLLVVLSLGVGVPTVYVVGRTVLTDRDGQVGVVGPFVIIGGILLGAYIDQSLSVTGPDTWVTPTLLVESWDGLFPTEAGAYPSTVGSVMIVGLMALMAFPVGTGAAIYLEEYAPDSGWQGKLAGVIELNIANLAGVPSVVYGLLGLALFQNVLDFAPGLVFSASATLGFLILPIVIVSAQEALRSVPDSLREASYGMGASRWQTVRSVVLPEAVPGILTGTILALGRAIGETAPLIVIAVATATSSAPEGLFSSGAALPLRLFSASANFDPAYRTGVVAALAIVLLVLMLTMNAIAIIIRNRYQ